MMSLWNRLFGKRREFGDRREASEDADIDTFIEISNSDETRQIDALVEKAQAYYPHKDPEKALRFFKKGIDLASPAPKNKSAQESRDVTATGHAFWMAWVCLDLLDRPSWEINALLDEARIKSPVTARRIEQRLAEAAKNAESRQHVERAVAILVNPERESSSRALDAISTLFDKGAWWELRDAGVRLRKSGSHDLAWKCLRAALKSATQASGNVASIYEAIGDLCKAENRHGEAARHYLASCVSGGDEYLKRSYDQIRISLKKARVSGDPAEIRQELLELARRDEASSYRRLDSYLSHVKAKS